MDEEIRKTATASFDGENITITIPKQYVREVLTNPDWMVSHAHFEVKDLGKACEFIADNISEADEDTGEGFVSILDLIIVDLTLKAWEEGDDTIVVPYGFEQDER